MTDTRALEAKFWKALGKDRTVMLGATGVVPRPMTALAEDNRAPIWFFTASDTELAQSLEGSRGRAAVATFAAKDHDLFATITGHAAALALFSSPLDIESADAGAFCGIADTPGFQRWRFFRHACRFKWQRWHFERQRCHSKRHHMLRKVPSLALFSPAPPLKAAWLPLRAPITAASWGNASGFCVIAAT